MGRQRHNHPLAFDNTSAKGMESKLPDYLLPVDRSTVQWQNSLPPHLTTTGSMNSLFGDFLLEFWRGVWGVFGEYFEVQAEEMIDESAIKELWPKNEFIFWHKTKIKTGKMRCLFNVYDPSNVASQISSGFSIIICMKGFCFFLLLYEFFILGRF